jgi:hypothetical protein
MKNRDRDLIGQFALGITVLGVGSYILMSSGVFDGESWLDGRKRTAKNPVVKSQEEMTQKWKDELHVIARESTEKAAELEDLTSRLAAIRLEIKSRLSDLSRVSRRGGRSSRPPSEDALPIRFSSSAHLLDYLGQSFPNEVFRFESQSGSDPLGQSQLVSMDRAFPEDSVFLRQAGLRWARAVSKAAIDLQVAALIVRYEKGETGVERARVLRQFLRDQLEALSGSSNVSTAPRVELEAVEPVRIASASKVDLFLKFSKMNN